MSASGAVATMTTGTRRNLASARISLSSDKAADLRTLGPTTTTAGNPDARRRNAPRARRKSSASSLSLTMLVRFLASSSPMPDNASSHSAGMSSTSRILARLGMRCALNLPAGHWRGAQRPQPFQTIGPRTRGDFSVHESRRALVDVVPVFGQCLQRGTIVGEVNALDHVTIDAEIVCALDIALLA